MKSSQIETWVSMMEDIVGCVSNQSLTSPHPLLFHWLAAHMAADF